MKKPIIGVSAIYDDARESLWMLPGYINGISEGGGVPIILPLHSSNEDIAQLCELCDGFLLTGGHDVSPSLYRESASEVCGALCEERDRVEREILRYAIERNRPLLGICRGIQLLNVVCGGSLYQDLPTQHPSSVNHHMTHPYHKGWHSVRLLPSTPLRELLGVDSIDVNSLHHQAIKELAPQLEAMAISEDGLIEAARHSSRRFIWGVQWHPEFAFHCNEQALALFCEFISHCKSANFEES